MTGRNRCAGLLGALLAAPAAAGEVVVWPLEVPRPGVVEVELHAEALSRLGDGGGFEVRDPEGRLLAAERSVQLDPSACRGVPVAGLEQGPSGWEVLLDLGSHPAAHGALRFELERAVLASGVALEASGDRKRWSQLARFDLFRLGEASGLARTRVEYPTSRDRFLRLLWPEAAGYPEVRAVEVCAPPEGLAGGPELALRDVEPESISGGTRGLLRLPARSVPVRALRIDLHRQGSEPVAVRLEQAIAGRWHLLSEAFGTAEATQLRLALPEAGAGSGTLRLTLWGDAVSSQPEMSWELVPQKVRFVARSAGRYTLTIPARQGSWNRLEPEPRLERLVVALGVGQVRRSSDRAAAAPGTAAPRARFARQWAVELPEGVEVGDPVSLHPPPLVGSTAADRSEVRLLAGNRLVPFRWRAVDEPRTELLGNDLRPEAVGRGRSRVRLEGAGRGEARQLTVRAPVASGALERWVELLGRRGGAPLAPLVTLWRGLWLCDPEPPRPCELRMALEGAEGVPAALEFHDGDAAPLSALTVEVDYRQEELLFLAPEAPVLLAAGALDLPRPSFDLAHLDAALSIRRPVAGRLGPEQVTLPGLASWGRWWVAGSVAVVALVLLGLLRKLLSGAAATGGGSGAARF